MIQTARRLFAIVFHNDYTCFFFFQGFIFFFLACLLLVYDLFVNIDYVISIMAGSIVVYDVPWSNFRF